MKDFSLETTLIPKLKENGIKFRYIGGVYDPMTIIVTHKSLDICRVDLNRDSNEPYSYNVYWFPSTVKNAHCLKRQYLISQELIDDIHKAIYFERGDNNMKVRVESVDMELNTASMINGPMASDYTIKVKVNVDGYDPNFSIRVKEAIEALNNERYIYYVGRGNDKIDWRKVLEKERDKFDINERYIYYGGRGNGKIDWRKVLEKERDKFDIKDVIFNNPATIVFWTDGTKTVVKAENEEFDPEKGLAMAIAKKALGNNYGYYDIFKKYVGKYEKKQKKGN